MMYYFYVRHHWLPSVYISASEGEKIALCAFFRKEQEERKEEVEEVQEIRRRIKRGE